MDLNNDVKKYNIKINCSLESIVSKLEELGYKNVKSYYKLNIYMIPENIDILKVNDLSNLENYAIIQDLNGENKKLIHKNVNEVNSSVIDDVIAIKNLLQKLKYNELMYINYDIYCYNNKNSDILIKNILKQGLFIEGGEELLVMLDKENISYDKSNLYIDNELVALNEIKGNIKDNMK